MKSRFVTSFLALLLFAACNTPRPAQQKVKESHVPKPQPTTSAQGYPYRPSTNKDFDLIHTELHVRFDWEKEQMPGEATLTLRPWFAPQSEVTFDAKGFLLQEVALVTPSGHKALKYDYADLEHLHIFLDRSYTNKETLQVYVAYIARSSELDSLVSEEAADDQGLYFINPRGETVGKPRQIWTQGESHGSPGWFPTFDTPNQRCTDDIYITVADSFKTLSNGILQVSQPNADGTRTDHWHMDLPHAPYLFMMAIGNYAIVKDQWRGREVSYYVEPAFAQYAPLIFGKTPQMIEFFSTRLGVDYPWPKYSQVVVRDFVSGAMENTSATTHYGRLQHDAREHIDSPEEDIISHELFHQWFGDLVTCESWANLSLNEGFATYGEYLWIEHAYGKDQATMHLLDDRRGYLRGARRGIHPIIHYYHQSADAMFDGHSYAKGGQVLHMLRQVVGDEAFFAALKLYLTDNAFDDVEIHKLRLAFEQVTGQDLNWFFDQWFLEAGHPVLDLAHGQSGGKYQLHVTQVQDLTKSPVFRLPITLDFVVGEKHKRVQVWMETADTTFAFEINGKPDHVCFDPDQALLCEFNSVIGPSTDFWLHQLQTAENFGQKAEAVAQLTRMPLSNKEWDVVLNQSQDPYWGTRMLVFERRDTLPESQALSLVEVALRLTADPKSDVRVMAIELLGERIPLLQQKQNDALKQRAVAAVSKAVADSSYVVGRSALETYYLLDSAPAVILAERLMTSGERHLYSSIARILRESNSPHALPFILQQIQDPAANLNIKTGLLRGFGPWLDTQGAAEQQQGVAVMRDLVINSRERWVRFFAVQGLSEMKRSEEIRKFMQDRLDVEQDEILKTAMKRYLDGR